MPSFQMRAQHAFPGEMLADNYSQIPPEKFPLNNPNPITTQAFLMSQHQ